MLNYLDMKKIVEKGRRQHQEKKNPQVLAAVGDDVVLKLSRRNVDLHPIESIM